MQQLDLFGFPIETPAQPKKKEKAVKAAVAPVTIAEAETVVVAEPVVIAADAPIVEPVTVTEPTPVEEPVAIAAAVPIVEPVPVTEATAAEEPVAIAAAAPIVEPVPVTEPTPVEEPVVMAIAAPVAEPVVMEIKETIAIPKPAAAKKITETKTVGKRGRKSFKEMDNEADLVEVPDDEVLQQKLYYSISEVASWFKVNTSLLRYWENEFDILQPRKTRKGDRLFRVEDVKNLQLIYFLLRQRKFSIDGAKNFLKNNRKEADTQVRLVESLTKFKSFLLELKANLVA